MIFFDPFSFQYTMHVSSIKYICYGFFDYLRFVIEFQLLNKYELWTSFMSKLQRFKTILYPNPERKKGCS